MQTNVHIHRFHVPIRHKDPEKYAHHLLFLYYPFRSGIIPRLNLDKINENKSKVEPYEELVDEAFRQYQADLDTTLDPYAQQENEEVGAAVDYESEDEETTENLNPNKLFYC